MITLAIAQTSPGFLTLDANLTAAMELVAAVEADIYLFPELFLSGYAFSDLQQVRRCALSPRSPQFDDVKRLTAERGIAICGGYVELDSENLYNSAFFMGDGRLLANYRKTHLFYREGQFFSPGDSGFSVFEYRGVRLGMMICFDWIFPESARSLALLGAQVVLHPANLVLPYCQRAMFARAVENRVFIATANRVGTESNTFGDDLTFTGGSQLVSPTGEYLMELDATEPGIRAVRIDPQAADDKALNPYNAILEDRRPELYVTQDRQGLPSQGQTRAVRTPGRTASASPKAPSRARENGRSPSQ
jgi:predicted amidohydrolase